MIINKTNKKKYSDIKISLLSNNNYLNLSHGLIKNSNTLNYKSFIPEKDGLFCDRIFGSSSNKCYCNKLFSSYKFNSICNICGVESKVADSRRSRLGHLELNDIFINSLYYKLYPHYLSIILNISKDFIKKILYQNYYIVILSSIKILKINKILNLNEYLFYKNKYYNKFYAGTGAGVLQYILKHFDILNEIKNIEKKNISFNILKNNKNLKRYKLLKKFFNSNIDVSKILIEILLVMPPDLRPIIKLPNSTVVSSDLNELYKRVIDRSNRLKEIKKYPWIPNIIYLNEKKNIQNSIDELFIGGGFNRNMELKSLSKNLKGKTGFFRQNLLGKRVDYSGRAVIVSGANLNFGECAIPETMAVELFRPFIYKKLLLNKDFNLKIAKDEVDKCSNLTLSILKNIIKNFYVLLNRAPTLHRLGMQSFKILLTKDKAIKVHPLVCSAFNADFDGDQMAVHIPLSSKSNVEYKNLLFSGNNILHPSNGDCCIVPTQEMILGLYYSTKIFNFKKNILLFNNIYEVLIAYDYGYINFNSCIFFRFKEISFKNYIYKIYKTTLGRILIFNNFFNKYPFSYFNKILDKKYILKIFNDLIYKNNFNSYMYMLSNNLMKLGFGFITKIGVSICIDDMFFCYNKKNILLKSFNTFIRYNIDYLNFFLTKKNKKKKILNLWDLTCDLISNFTFKDLSFSNYIDHNNIFIKSETKNSLYLMMLSGSRGSESQIKQICSNRGFINYKKYGFLEIPVLNSLRDGLNVFEYFYFSHNSRKTLADTALKTSSAGYLTRRLVESSNNVFISEFDCGTSDGLFFKSLVYKGIVIEDFFERIFGRFNSIDIYFDNKILFKKNTFIDINIINSLKKLNINIIKIRSPLKCKSKLGICSLCYGSDLSKNKIVNIGEMVGIIAGQSIGEPGTQLTMRTFHTGGAVGKALKLSFFKSNNNGFLKYSLSLKYVTNKDGFKIVVSRIGKIKIYNDNDDELENFNIPYSSYLLQNHNVYINKGDLICKWNPSYDLFVSENKGYIKFNNFIENYNFIKKIDSDFYEIIDNEILPTIDLIIKDNNIIKYKLEGGNLVLFDDGSTIEIGDILIKNPLGFNTNEDMVGGLPKINNFFEARSPQNSAVLSICSGIVKFNILKKKKYINIVDENNNNLISIIWPHNKKILVTHNQYINKGEIIIDGELNPHDILYVHGLDYLVNYFLEEIKYIYFSQGIKINDKHLEIIISQMLNNGVVVDPGNSGFIIGETVPVSKINNFNYNSCYKSRIKYNLILLGITKKSLNNECFLSAASFQRTTSILGNAAINSKSDKMSSIKNAVMSGNVFRWRFWNL
ncbi:DNA-directed RNA polymerase subunit beta' [Candidatus Nasuia deltocephalinicola]|uniref:DNA-directed RNA polymerase subunit beta' n=1 Tax=Candidatus Nasuia deltocephalincola TaxID=1160784 RepID=UPI00216B5AE6|nr:DNA-directed RNA polymerase subunit beta' [Candidatus Nasuia deltocephalinicola]